MQLQESTSSVSVMDGALSFNDIAQVNLVLCVQQLFYVCHWALFIFNLLDVVNSGNDQCLICFCAKYYWCSVVRLGSMCNA